jgi:hypothetical protein
MKPFWNWVPKIGYLFYTDLKTWIMKEFSSYFIKLLIYFYWNILAGNNIFILNNNFFWDF